MGFVLYMTNAMNQWIKERRKLLIKAFGGCCQRILEDGTICGSKRRLEFAHKEKTKLSGRGRGRKERYYDILRYPWKYGLVCHECHNEFDSNPEEVKVRFNYINSILD